MVECLFSKPRCTLSGICWSATLFRIRPALKTRDEQNVTKTLANFCFKIYRPSERNRKKNTTHFKRHDGKILCRPYPYGSSKATNTNLVPRTTWNQRRWKINRLVRFAHRWHHFRFRFFYHFLFFIYIYQCLCLNKSIAKLRITRPTCVKMKIEQKFLLEYLGLCNSPRPHLNVCYFVCK